MSKISIDEVKKIPPSRLLSIIQKAKNSLKKNKVFKKMCKEFDLDVNVIDLVPVKFGDLDVSAQTKHGIITLNYKLLCDDNFSKNYMYLLHEAQHNFDQCFGDKPTMGAADGPYLDNPFEQEAFKRQIQYLDDQYGEDQAEDYVDHLLNHHDIKNTDERDDKKDILMEKVNEE